MMLVAIASVPTHPCLEKGWLSMIDVSDTLPTK